MPYPRLMRNDCTIAASGRDVNPVGWSLQPGRLEWLTAACLTAKKRPPEGGLGAPGGRRLSVNYLKPFPGTGPAVI